MAEPKAIRIERADPFQGDVILYFSDGTSVLYDAQLLFASRNANGNRIITNVSLDDEAPESIDKWNDASS